MDAQLHRHEEDNRNIAGLHSGEGEHEHHKSVLKKVKDKAKKIKDKIKLHGHEHEHEHDDEDDEDDEMGADPEVHGASMYESTVISCTNLPRQIDPNLEKPVDPNPNPNPNIRDEGIHRPSSKMGPDFGMRPTVQDEGIHKPSPKIGSEFRTPTPPSETHAYGAEASNLKRGNLNVEEPKVRTGAPMGLEEDPHSYKTPSNYESKITDPTHGGGKEADVSPLVRKFDDLNVRDESKSKPESEQKFYTGSHDQFAPQPNPTKDQFNPESNPDPKSFDSSQPESMPRDTVAGKISLATSAITDKAVSAKNVVASKLGYGGGGSHVEETGHDNTPKKPVTELATDYAHTVYDKVAGAGSAVMSKVQGTSSGGSAPAPEVAGAGSAVISKVQGSGGGDKHHVATENKGVSMKEYLVEKLKPGDEDKALSEAITDVFQKKKGGVVKEEEEKKKPIGKVTESEEVAARLGTGKGYKREGEDAVAAGSESSGQGVVERVKDAMGLWFGKSTGMQTAQESVGQAHVSGVSAASTPTGGVGHGKEEKNQ
ncbi:hypothetical protein ACJIZ3_009171 [Penstemon smallii]|uniref:Low-temperature-induced 65 kDa protein-like n=1 Tax=Penstemon smallii TaxID=265156 RepID=A0ABD3TCK2_9LAMI